MVLAAVMLVGIVGMVGLAVDLGVAYYLKARLSQAADAASLAGARSLARGQDLASQAASAQAVATSFFNANFPNGFWGCTTSLSTPAVTENDTTKIRYVTINATATMPLYFMRALGVKTAKLGTSAQAARRDANIMVILDRSTSMNQVSNAVSELVSGATWFVGQFAPGRDKVGLVTFGGSYYLRKPTTSFSPNVVNDIKKLTINSVQGVTNHSQALWVAYQALAELKEPDALNAVVFFTDGQPNTITADFRPLRKNPTTTNCDKLGTNGKTMIGYASGAIGQGFFGTTNVPFYEKGTLAQGTTPTAMVLNPYDPDDSETNELLSQINKTNYDDCLFEASSRNYLSDLSQLPTSDLYGNLTNPSNHYKSVVIGPSGAWKDNDNFTNLAFNAGDNAAYRMRSGPLNSVVPLIDCIALHTSDDIDAVYMKRLANTVDSPIYDRTKPTGLYVYAQTTADLQSAFAQIASQIFHLSQ